MMNNFVYLDLGIVDMAHTAVGMALQPRLWFGAYLQPTVNRRSVSEPTVSALWVLMRCIQF